MKQALIAVLAAAALPSLAPAQLVVSDGAPFAIGDFYHYDLTCGTTTPLPVGLSFWDLAADEAGSILYLVGAPSPTSTSTLYRWPFGAPAPTPVGVISSQGIPLLVEAMTFGNGRLYITTGETASQPCRSPVYELDPASPAAATPLFDPGPSGYFFNGIAFDPGTGLLILSKIGFKPWVCVAASDGLYTLDPATLSLNFLATYPGTVAQVSGYSWGSITVGGGKVWWAGYGPELFHNFDLSTQTWDPSPQSHAIATGFGPKLGVTWSPTLVAQGACGPVSYCTSGTSASGCNAQLTTTGTASATASSGFTLDASGVEGQKVGTFLFAANGRQANAWGNSTSYQCVVPPIFRSGLLGGAGTVGSCDGAFTQDLNALWCAACPQPAKNPGAGAVAQAQLWYRDPFSTSNQTSSFSDAAEFTVEP